MVWAKGTLSNEIPVRISESWGGTSWWWQFVKENVELSFTVYSGPEKKSGEARGKLHTHNSQSYVNAKLRSWVEDYNRGGRGRIFSSPSELEAALDDIFEYLYRKKLEKLGDNS